MASFTVTAIGAPTGSGVKTLSGTTADEATISPVSRYWLVEILNLSSSQPLGFRSDGTTAVAAAAGVVRIPALGSVIWPASYLASTGIISIVGNGNDYQVNLIPAT